MEKRPEVSFLYHFFPHYRRGVVRALDKIMRATFVADAEGIEGIVPYEFNNGENFYVARCCYMRKLAFQPKSIWYCLRASDDAFVFLANPNHISTWINALIARARGKRVVFWGHGFKSARIDFKNVVRKIYFSLAHGYYTYGWRAKQNAIALGFRPENIYVGFNSLDYDTQIPIRQKLLASQADGAEPPSGELKIFCISRLTKTCRYDMLLDAVAILALRNTKCVITFVGDGPERYPLERRALEIGVSANFLGAIYADEEVAELIFNSDVTVQPGKIGLTAMHSMMYGTPVLTHDDFEAQMPEVEAVVPGYTGEFFSHGSTESLVEKLAFIHSRRVDRSVTRLRCFEMMDKIYNPDKQATIMLRAVLGDSSEGGDDAFTLFGR